jgi:hypothetical protein
MRTARSITSGENFGDFLMMAPFSIEGASSKTGAVHYLRSHWLRMPLHLLLPHLLRKAWMAPIRKGKPQLQGGEKPGQAQAVGP